MGLFRTAHRSGWAKRSPSLKSAHISDNDKTWHSYTLLKEDPKNIWITWHLPWVLLIWAFFQRKSANFAILQNTDRLHFGASFLILLTFFESLKIVLINMVTIFMMSAKMAALSLHKIKVLHQQNFKTWLKSYGHVTNVW